VSGYKYQVLSDQTVVIRHPPKRTLIMSAYQELEAKLDSLIELCLQLKRENQSLRARESSLAGERGKLLEQNEIARQKIETMINRLRNLNAE
jgi:cell division protein ZapB